MPAKKTRIKIEIQKELLNLLYIVTTVLILLLSILNLETKNNTSSSVLGIRTYTYTENFEKEKEFWEDFLAEHPTYYDGWQRLSEIELLTGNSESYFIAREITKRIDFNR